MCFLVHYISTTTHETKKKVIERKPNCLFLLLIKINGLRKCVGGLEIDQIDFSIFL